MGGAKEKREKKGEEERELGLEVAFLFSVSPTNLFHRHGTDIKQLIILFIWRSTEGEVGGKKRSVDDLFVAWCFLCL